MSVNQIWLRTWLFVYVLKSDHKTDPSEKKNLFCGLTHRSSGNLTIYSAVFFDSDYLHDGRADKNPYPHDRRADKDSYPHNSNNQRIIIRLQLSFVMNNVQLMLV